MGKIGNVNISLDKEKKEIQEVQHEMEKLNSTSDMSSMIFNNMILDVFSVSNIYQALAKTLEATIGSYNDQIEAEKKTGIKFKNNGEPCRLFCNSTKRVCKRASKYYNLQ